MSLFYALTKNNDLEQHDIKPHFVETTMEIKNSIQKQDKDNQILSITYINIQKN